MPHKAYQNCPDSILFRINLSKIHSSRLYFKLKTLQLSPLIYKILNYLLWRHSNENIDEAARIL
ncbi:hypothetical protein HCCG_01177 [Helicobacter cinaedi CCUG 18818 = ATCC BAA-847]|uniref:Uncharacterized protein n=1 Tax=Helicobacter cinaedi CCUG 18818 = ATCC BAA-847 TaxID=537971 RepID=A0ABN0BAS7_9HELI|nr:hypothetical protein [Helicobacter cinaedi]EFR46630.1 hypothetical protein HCCG_01177 [Helicobacter cinaedi CCUG 18818 = ATCC BAA-847]